MGTCDTFAVSIMAQILIRLTPVLLVCASLVAAATAFAEEPDVTYQFPADGAVLEERPPAVQLCFRKSIDVRDLDKGGEFRFAVRGPDGMQLGHRAIFQPDGLGVVVQPGLVPEPEGDWTFEWNVRDRESEDPGEGTIRFSVAPGGDPVIASEPPACSSETTPAAERSPDASEPTPNGGAIEPEEGDGPDVLLLALLTTGAAAAAGVVALIGYFVRKRIGFFPHRPPERSDREDPHH
jgi:hypothetical protein